MRKDEAALELADAFITEYRKVDFRFPSMKTVTNSKWWIHFERAAELRYLKDWNARIWVKCQFDKYDKILPFRLYGKMAEEAFNEYKFRYIEGQDDREKQVITAILATFNDVKVWCKKNNNGEINYSEYFKNPRIRQRIKRKELSLHFISICKSFDNQGLIDSDSLKIKRAIVHKNKKLKNKLIEVMDNEFF